SPCSVEILKTDYGVPTGSTRPRSLTSAVRLGDFHTRGAVSLAGYAGQPYALLMDPAGLAVRLTHSASKFPPAPVVLFNVWGDPGRGYFSPEPWVGLQNSLNLQEGLIFLGPGEHYEWKILIEPQREVKQP
ncbi:MAG: hypothetical protein ACE5MK_12955, partial [Acidobacteriota bacterium]